MTFYRAKSEAVCLGLVLRLDSEQRTEHKCAGAAGGRRCTWVQWWQTGDKAHAGASPGVPERGHRAACTWGRAPERRCLGSRGQSCQTTAGGTWAALARCPRPAGSHVPGLAALGSLATLSCGASTPNPAHSPGELCAGRACSWWMAIAAGGPSGLRGAPAPAAHGGAAAPQGGTVSAGTRQLSAMGW